MSHQKCHVNGCDYPQSQCSGACSLSTRTGTLTPIRPAPMNPNGAWTFRELEMKVLDHHRKNGYISGDVIHERHPRNELAVGQMIMDLMMICENLDLDFTRCLATAYEAATGDKK